MSDAANAERFKLTVAEEVRVALARRRVSGVKLAELIGRSQVYISRRLRGEVAFDVEDLALVADALDVAVADLLPKKPGAPTAGDAKKPIDPLAQRVIATIGEPRPGRHATARRTGRLDNPPRPVRNGRDRRPMAVVAASDRNPRRA